MSAAPTATEQVAEAEARLRLAVVTEAALEWVPVEITRQMETPTSTLLPNRCVLASAVGYEVMRHFGYPVEPVAVKATLFNPPYVKWLEEGSGDEEALREAGGWVVVTNTEGEAEPKHWTGHLVLRNPVNDSLLDFDLRQMRRPAKDILVPKSAAFALPPGWDEGRTADYALNDCVLVYEKLDKDDWKRGPDWVRRREGKYARVAGATIRHVRKALKVAGLSDGR